jgi:methylated-DNA-protein-cysteine methyltransferase-like protein
MAAKRNTRPSWEPVFRFVKSIPRGSVISYGELARALRLPGGARTAGRAMAATPRGRGIPWHRVLGAGGRLLVREPYASLQRRLLESEGVRFIQGRVDWKRHAWTKPKGRARIALRSARASVLRFSGAKPR